METPEGLRIIVESKSKTFLAFCFCFLIGIGLASLAGYKPDKIFFFFAALCVAAFFTAYFWSNASIRFIFAVFVFIGLGILRYLYFIPEQSDPSRLPYYYGERLRITAKISGEPSRKISSAEYVLGDIRENSRISGKMILRLPLYPELRYGSTLELICAVSAPKNFNDNFRYDKYLAVKGIDAICDYPEIISVQEEKPSDFYAYLLLAKEAVKEKVARLWPEPAGSLMAGLIYGEKSGFSDKLSEDFQRTGLSHIIAVSGYNVSVVAGFLLSVLILIGLYRRPALGVAIFGIIVFVVFVGASASAVRAGVMGSIVLIGQFLGRPSRAAPALALAASLMAAINPLILVWDAGFQLSCLATAGIIFAPKTDKRWLEPAVMTLAATVATLPLILMQFGRLSLVSLPVNLLIIWLIPWLMLVGFAAVILSFIFYPVAFIVAALADLGLNYVIFVAEKFSALGVASIDIRFSPWLMVLSYVIIILLVKKYVKEKN